MKQAALILAMACVAFALPAFAAEQTFVCNMTKKEPGGPTQSFRQKFELDLDTKSAVNVENWGSGWEVTRRGQFVSADDTRITLEDNPLLHAYIDRGTGEFYGEVLQGYSKLEREGRETVTYKQGTVFHGQCKQVAAPPSRSTL